MAGLLLGTPSGVYALRGSKAALVGLNGQFITHLAASPAAVAAAVPVPAYVHKMYPTDHTASAPQLSGLHLLLPSEDAPSGHTSQQVWAGDARSCCIWQQHGSTTAAGDVAGIASNGKGASGGGSGSGSGGPSSTSCWGLAVGIEPADVFVSLDGGSSWSGGTDSFASAPSRPQWSFPAPPHQPHVLSLERWVPGGMTAGRSATPARLVAGIEVGGVLVGGEDAGGKSKEWEERNEGVCTDVHSCRVDPHDSSHWLAVTGRGLYATHDAGASWRPQGSWAGKYTVGLAFNPQRKGEVLVAAGDKPPAVGAHVFHSTDAGESWQDITSAVTSSERAQALGSRTPVPFFWEDQAMLGTATGHLLGAADVERKQWRVLASLPQPILCMAAPGHSPSTVMH